jgi:hypothetical protein
MEGFLLAQARFTIAPRIARFELAGEATGFANRESKSAQPIDNQGCPGSRLYDEGEFDAPI